MSDYIPTTQAVRSRYSMQEPVQHPLEAEFDRWLEAHDREVAARAWNGGHDHCFRVERPDSTGNPYKETND